MPASRQTIDEQAAEWILRVHEEGFNEALRAEFERWQQLSPQHAAAALRMQDVIARLQSLREQSAPAKAPLPKRHLTQHLAGANVQHNANRPSVPC